MSDTFDAPGRCHGCAFTPGTEANLSPLTLAKAQLTVMAADPFYCHATVGADGTLPDEDRRLCAGWADMMTAYYRRGFFGPGYDRKVPMFRAGLAALTMVEDRLLAGDDPDSIDFPSVVMAALEEVQP